LNKIDSRIFSLINSCRACNYKNLLQIFSLGITPLADRLLREDQLNSPEYFVPLDVLFCPSCSLVQISATVNPEILFNEDYPYYSSVSESYLQHAVSNAHEIINKRKLGDSSLVIEPASNDGYMLKAFADKGIPVLGIDPSGGPASVAEKSGIPTLCAFFTHELVQELVNQSKYADVIIANNVLAHVRDLNDFVRGLKLLLKEDGIVVIEVPYIRDLISDCEFDTIYHQHLCYFSLSALDRLFRNHSLYINQVRRLPVHGGSLRIYIEHHQNIAETVWLLLEEEQDWGIYQVDRYLDFADTAASLRKEVLELLRNLKKEGANICGYGAAAKATTFLSYCGIDDQLLDYIVDISEFKHGLYMGKNHLPIYPPGRLLEDLPEYLLILAWNFAEEIMQQQKEYHQFGGKFIIPIPQVRIL